VVPDPDPDRALGESLAGLAELLLFPRSLTDTLIEVATFAAAAIPGADGAGLALLETARVDTVVASTQFVATVDEVQYRLKEGPCLMAVEAGAIQMSGSLGGELRWPRFGPQAGRLGVHSALSLPLQLEDRVVGSLNIYGHARDAFDTRAVRIGQLFARPAAVTVANALLLEESRRLSAQLDRALISRAVIDRAIGIGMSRTGSSSDEALDHLRKLSQSSGTKLADVSREIVDAAVARARERHRRPRAQDVPTDPSPGTSDRHD
jgi:GAF domain-containing protein